MPVLVECYDPFPTRYYGNGGAKFPKKIRLYQQLERIGRVVWYPRFQIGAESRWLKTACKGKISSFA
jgi:hypothetical protein